MKQIVLILMSILSFSCSSQTQRQATDTTEPVSKKILVVYFSCTGTTRRVAESIAGAVDGRLYRITPAEVYTSADLDWNTISYFSAILFGGTCVRVRSIRFLKNTIFPVKPLSRSLLPEEVR